ncbi:MAG: hypothetical protein PVH19_03215 [Planctomycetia bacterium]
MEFASRSTSALGVPLKNRLFAKQSPKNPASLKRPGPIFIALFDDDLIRRDKFSPHFASIKSLACKRNRPNFNTVYSSVHHEANGRRLEDISKPQFGLQAIFLFTGLRRKISPYRPICLRFCSLPAKQKSSLSSSKQVLKRPLVYIAKTKTLSGLL